MVDINSIENYKICRKKKVDYWLCVPPKGTVVIQKFEQYNLLQQLKPCIRGISDSCFIQAKDFLALKQSNAQLYNFILQNCDIVGKSGNNIVVICGTEGELWTTTYDYACKHYQAFSYNTVISLAQAVNERAKKYGNDNVVPWMRVTSSSSNQYFACFVPVKEKGILMTAQGQVNNYNQLGVVSCSKCDSCGGSIKPLIAKDESNRELFKDYLKDLNFAKRYVHHMYNIRIRNMSKYERYFNRNYNCSISLEEGVIPYLDIKITNGVSFSEDFKFFVSCSVNHKPIGSLYRDYGFDAKGVKLHTFRINTDKNILDFFDYVMNYVRKGIREA